MKYLSVCAGIEAATVAWHDMGWTPVAFSEIEPFPSAVLAHHYPNVPNLGDMTKYHEWPDLKPNLIVGGTPCQAFSVAGLREGLADPRGNLTLTFLGLVARYRPEWVVWENVPGVLSSTNGQPPCPPPDRVGVEHGERIVVTQEYEEDQAFAALLAGLAKLGYGCAYRILDAQYFGVAQRRRRVFVVGCLGDWQRAAQVLLEPESMSGNPAPLRKKGKGIAPTLAARTKGGGGLGTDADLGGACIPIQEPGKRTGRSTNDTGFGLGVGRESDPMFTLQAGSVHGVAHVCSDEVSPCLGVSPAASCQPNVGNGQGAVVGTLTTRLASNAMGAPEIDGGHYLAWPAHTLRAEGFDAGEDGTGRGTPIVPIAGAIAFNHNAQAAQLPSDGRDTSINDGLTCSQGACVNVKMAVRRLTPTECERLQGFSDGYTNIPWRNKPDSPDGPRYKALGNSMAVPVMRWIGRRIDALNSQPICLDE